MSLLCLGSRMYEGLDEVGSLESLMVKLSWNMLLFWDVVVRSPTPDTLPKEERGGGFRSSEKVRPSTKCESYVTICNQLVPVFLWSRDPVGFLFLNVPFQTALSAGPRFMRFRLPSS